MKREYAWHFMNQFTLFLLAWVFCSDCNRIYIIISRKMKKNNNKLILANEVQLGNIGWKKWNKAVYWVGCLTLIWGGSRQDDRVKLFDFSHILVYFINAVPDVLDLETDKSETTAALKYYLYQKEKQLLCLWIPPIMNQKSDLREELVHEGCVVHSNLHLVVILITSLT